MPDTVVYVLPSLNVTVIDPVPVAVILKFAVAPSQIVVLPVIFAVGLGTTLIVVAIGIFINAPNASVILVILTETDPVCVIVPILNGVPLTAVTVPEGPPTTE